MAEMAEAATHRWRGLEPFRNNEVSAAAISTWLSKIVHAANAHEKCADKEMLEATDAASASGQASAFV
jgi:hypothetical protein